MFLPHTKNFNALATYCGRAYSICEINNPKTMGGRYAVHKRQAILSTTVVISSGEREQADPPEGRGSNHVILVQIGHSGLLL